MMQIIGKCTKKEIKAYVILSILGVLFVIADQVTKLLICKRFPNGETLRGQGINVIDNFFEISRVHNTGGAWGVFSELTWLLTLFSIVSVLLLLFIYLNAEPTFLKLSVMLIISGAVGNIIDRVRLGYVVDFLNFHNLFGYSFPVFNFADICVTAGAVGLLIFVIFMSKKEPFRAGTLLARFFSGEEENDGDNNV